MDKPLLQQQGHSIVAGAAKEDHLAGPSSAHIQHQKQIRIPRRIYQFELLMAITLLF